MGFLRIAFFSALKPHRFQAVLQLANTVNGLLSFLHQILMMR